MTITELIEILEDIANVTDEDAQVNIIMQPGHSLKSEIEEIGITESGNIIIEASFKEYATSEDKEAIGW